MEATGQYDPSVCRGLGQFLEEGAIARNSRWLERMEAI
jgi:hypothetical protein